MNKKSKDKLFKVTLSKTRLTAHPQLTEGAQCSPRQVGVMEMVAARELLGRGLGRARLCRTSPGRRHSWPHLRTAASPKLGHAALCSENFPENIKDKKTGIKRNDKIE